MISKYQVKLPYSKEDNYISTMTSKSESTWSFQPGYLFEFGCLWRKIVALPRCQSSYISIEPLLNLYSPNIGDTAGPLNYRVQTLTINGFRLTVPPLLVFFATLLSTLSHRFQDHTPFSAHPSHSSEPVTYPAKQPKKNNNLRSYHSPRLLFLLLNSQLNSCLTAISSAIGVLFQAHTILST